MAGLTAATLFTVLLISLAPAPSAAALQTFSETYGPFNDLAYYNTIFQVQQPALIHNDALQVTPDSLNPDVSPIDNKSGRVFLKKRFKLWEGSVDSVADRVASFNVYFRINIFRPQNLTAGEGLAFVIAPDFEIPLNSSGKYLGLTNSSTDGQSSNQIVAVELDTVKQDFDPDDNHVGLNIHSVRSKVNASLTPLGIELAPIGAKFYDIWIQYDGVNKSIQVFIAPTTQLGPSPPQPTVPVLKSPLELRGVVNQNSYFGFSASTGSTVQLNCVLRWNLTVEHYAEGNGEQPFIKIVIAVVVPTLVLILIAAAVGYYVYKRRRGKNNYSDILGALRSLPGTPREFEFKDLKKATNNFDEKNKLGQGGYGVVYRGTFQSENLEVAVKWFSRGNIQGQDDFLSELTIINRLRHKHLVPLRGWCHKNGKLLLVYEYMANGSLDMHLFNDGPDRKPLSWTLRYKIISGVASALQYLHNEYDQKVVHRDLKASNIMIDTNFNARLGDFGLARALDAEKTSYAEAEGVLGTLGYIAPECFHTGKATQHSDVYAFGAVLLEVVCGIRPGSKTGGYQFLVDWVWSLYREGRLLDAVDERLKKKKDGDDDYDNENVVNPEEAERILLLGLACSHPTASERPKTQTIPQMISGSMALPKVAPFRPSFVWPSLPMGMDGLSLSTTATETKSFTMSEWTPRYSIPDSNAPATPDGHSFNNIL
ncbi:probable L-type lectin-domain containing receptor kinase S.5 [Impatiens glandulifera]|uniref:probable L-type lectin-domain containing receptor kinase S.5 n=1 Tax=Impatiens glandulifera TaxID=253017 RepID=UPI001FB124DF|nr:probable L-type lectin-domain containing receptor kinase S.5 [Impatiens glandulifera]